MNNLIDIYGGKDKLAKAIRNVGVFSRFDSWVNSLTGQGTSRDKRAATVFGTPKRVSQNHALLDDIYHGNDLGRKIVDLYVEEQTRNWVTLRIADDGGAGKSADIMQAMRDLDVRKEITDALAWSRLFGGGAIIIIADDGRKMSEPLDVDNLKAIKHIHAVDRWQLSQTDYYTADDEEVDDDFRKIGRPKTYILTEGQTSKEIHESRVLRFEGARTTYRRWRENGQWSDSIFEAVYVALRDFDSGWQGAHTVMQDFSQGVYKISGLANLLASDNDDLVMKRLQQIDVTRSHARAIAIDAENEEFTTQGAAVTGLADLMEMSMLRLSAAVDIPVTRLFGRSASGLAATGEHDETNFENKIKNEQTTKLIPRLEYLVSLIMASKEGPTGGVIPENWSIDPNPLSSPTDKEKAETRKINADADKVYIDAGVLVQTEVRESRFGGDEYGSEITLDESVDIEAREEERAAQESARLEKQMQANEQNEEKKQDAAGYQIRQDSTELCSNCGNHGAGKCQRWDFYTDRGHGCDDYTERKSDSVIVHIERKADSADAGAGKVVKIRGSNV